MVALRTWSEWKHSSHKLVLLCAVGLSFGAGGDFFQSAFFCLSTITPGRPRPLLSTASAPADGGANRMSSQPPTNPSPAPQTSGEYVVVARRYRPQTFDALVGQEHVARALSGAISQGRVGHAYLFTGARGVGKTSAARIFAKALCCESGPTPTPCNECDVCQTISTGDDIDVLEIDGASNRGIDEIRQLRQNVGVRPSRARFKIYIIDEVHMLTKEAFNALLKTLEEPPEHVKFIFATTEPGKIPITIISRCQRFDFAGIDAEAIGQRLAQIAQAEGVEAEPEALALLARRAAGSMRDGQSLLEQILAFTSDKITVEGVNSLLGMATSARLGALVTHLAARRAAGALAELDAALAEGVEVSQLADQLLGYFRDAMVAAVGCPPEQLLHTTPSQAAEVAELGEQFGVETLLAVVQILEQTLARMRLSVHGRTLVETSVVRICKLEDLDELATLIASLREGGAVLTATPTPQSVAPKKNVAPATDRSESPSVPTSPLLPQSPPAPSSAPTTSQPPAPGPPIPLTDASASAIWKEVIDRLTSENELVADQAALFECLATSAPNTLVVSFPAKYNSCKSFCEQPLQRAKLEKTLAEVAGQTVRLALELIETDPAQPSSSPPGRTPSRRERHAEVAARPFVRRAMELFDAADFRIDPPDSPS